MRIIGIDPGLANFGLCVVRLEPSREVVEHVRVIRTEKADKKRNLRVADDTADRIRLIAGELHALMSHDVVALCVEASALPFGKIKTSVVSALGRVRGIVDMLAVVHSLPVIEEGPQVLKRIVTGDRYGTKQQVIDALESRYPELEDLWPKHTTLREHAADAVAAVVAGLESDVIRAVRRTLPREVA